MPFELVAAKANRTISRLVGESFWYCWPVFWPEDRRDRGSGQKGSRMDRFRRCVFMLFVCVCVCSGVSADSAIVLFDTA